MNQYPYYLEPGPRNKHICPHCHRRSFVRYIYTDGTYIDESVGKCDHVHSCGYMKAPRDFEREHPGGLKVLQRDWIVNPPQWLGETNNDVPHILEEPSYTFPMDIVIRTQRYDLGPEVNLWRFFDTVLDPLITEGVFVEYGVGFTKDRSPIYWQFDKDGRCRSGKIIQYGLDGHRIKNGDAMRITWAHSLIRNKLPEGWKLSQCLFGEDLLTRHPFATVGLVESEKTALLCAGKIPHAIWLATGGRNTNIERAKAVLKDRRVVVFPDMDAYEEWRGKFAQCRNMVVSDTLLKNTKTEEHSSTLDIADLIIQQSLSY